MGWLLVMIAAFSIVGIAATFGASGKSQTWDEERFVRPARRSGRGL